MDDHIRESLADPEFREAWRRTEPEYQVARQLVALRLKRGLSRKDLASRVGTTQSVIARIESSRHNPTVRTLARLAEALDAEGRIEIRSR